MSKKTSNYRHEYRGINKSELRNNWENNSNYRDVRRQSEHCHTPHDWQDDGEWIDVDEGISEPSTGRRPASAPVHKRKHEQFNKAYQDRLRQLAEYKISKLNLNDDGYVTSNSSLVSPSDEVVQNDHQMKKNVKNMNNNPGSYSNGLNSSGEGKVRRDMRTFEKKKVSELKKTFKVGRQNASKVIRPQSAPGNSSMSRSPIHYGGESPRIRSPVIGHIQPPIRHILEPDYVGKQSPFVAYGCKDKEMETANKRTHNVRASAKIYKSALRAKDRRQILLEDAEEKLRSASHKENKIRALLSHLYNKDKSMWNTEYRRSFVDYDEGYYKKSLALRQDPKALYEEYSVR